MVKCWVACLLVALYGAVFSAQELYSHQKSVELSPPLPAPLYQTLGYLKQLGAEALYIKAVVFLGGRDLETEEESYGENLADHFSIMASLHPRLMDIHYLTESTLPWINIETAKTANDILEKGYQARPDEWLLPFYLGFNYFRFLNDFSTASHFLQQASQTDGAPSWIGHLAAVLAAKGGNILGGLAWLRAMHATETEEHAKARYAADIKVFENAAAVLGAISAYTNKYGNAPEDLRDLTPEFLWQLPVIGGGYELHYEKPTLRLQKSKPS